MRRSFGRPAWAKWPCWTSGRGEERRLGVPEHPTFRRARGSRDASVSGFDIRHERINGGVDLLAVSGFLDGHTFERLESAIGDLYSKGCYKLIVDLADVEFISSAGIGVLIGASVEADDSRGKLVLLSPSPEVTKVFDLLALSDAIPVTRDREEALRVVTTGDA